MKNRKFEVTTIRTMKTTHEIVAQTPEEALAIVNAMEEKELEAADYSYGNCIESTATVKGYTTPKDFHYRYNHLLNDSDLERSLERILQGVLDRDGVIATTYGYSMDDPMEGNRWYIEVETSSYWYESAEERNKDVRALTEIITEFSLVNNLTKKSLLFPAY